ncbi:MAG TPA: histidine--tRNA ligase [Gemmatimonadaceae bacterium]|jgi:histidyl-tRNA synthetase|nr:histidine--tRNA ligase [Gemmatimonadaceae bacterium]
MFKSALPGFRDFYPQELAERAFIMSTWRDVARRYAFVEYDGPPLEPLELYTRKSGEEIVGQLYNFVDKGGREVALRPEMTPTVARMVAARANALRKPVRWFSMPQLFRYERQQKGRLREHYQLNVDIFGSADVAADAELVACAVDMMRAFGLTSADVVARVSNRRILQAFLESLGVPSGSIEGVYGVVDKLERQPAQVSSEKLAALGVPSESIERIVTIADVQLSEIESRLSSTPAAAHVSEFAAYLRYVETLLGGDASWLRLDLSIVRGLAYYTGIVFELFDRSGEFRAICGGGRYDTLLQSLGGADMPALGFGMGDVVLGELLRGKGLMAASPATADYWVAGDDEVPLERIMREAASLRASGHSVEYALRPQSLSKQKKAAQASGARTFVTLSNDGTNG